MTIIKVIAGLLLFAVSLGVIIGTTYAVILVAPFLFAFLLLAFVMLTIGTLIAEAKEEKEQQNNE